MTYLSDIIRFVENAAGHRLNRDEGIQHGKNDRLNRGATLAWMASPDAIRAAGAAGHDLLIGHESLYFPYDVIVADNPPPGWREWQINRQRFDLWKSTSFRSCACTAAWIRSASSTRSPNCWG